MKSVKTAAVILALFATASWAQHSSHQSVRAVDLKWAPVPSLPSGAQIAVIEGPMNQAVPFIMKPGTPHFAWTDAETVVQLHGTGPWGITYLNAADDPRNQ